MLPAMKAHPREGYLNHFNTSWIVPVNISFDGYNDPTYFTILHVNSVISTAAVLLAFYFILFKSPPSIGTYKWYLFNISACSYLFDVHMTYIYTPQPLFPALIMCTKGLLEPLGWFYGGITGFYGFIVLFGACSMSIVWAFAYRYTLVTNRAHLLNCPLGVTLMAMGQLFYEVPTLFWYTMSILDREAVVEVNYALYPRVKPFVEGHSCTVTAFEASIYGTVFIVFCALQFGLMIPLNGGLLYCSFNALNARKSEMSSKTARMHRQLLFSLVAQMIVPFCTIFIPFTLNAIFVAAKAENISFYAKALFEIGTLHSLFNSVTMIYHIQPYRNAVKALFCPKRSGVAGAGGPSASTNAVAPTTNNSEHH